MAQPDATSETPVTYYGPLPPCDTDEECEQQNGPGFKCVDQGGGWRSCTNPVDAGVPDATNDCQPMAYYGPMPCTDDGQCESLHGTGWYCDQDNGYTDPCTGFVSWPICQQDMDAGVPDATNDCQPMTYYGPMPCSDDPECESTYGAGWYCDQDNGYTDPCSGWIPWPACMPPPPDDAGTD